MVVPALQQVAGIGVTAGADDVVDRPAMRVDAVPTHRVVDDRRHGPQVGKAAPHSFAGGDVRAVQGAGLARIKAFRQVFGVPEVEITHLRAINR